MLEETKLPYKVIPVDLSKGEQFEEKFIKISPFSKIPVIRDSETKKCFWIWSNINLFSRKE